jgi:hypothetical protein
MPRPSHSSRFYHLNYTGRGVQINKLHNILFFLLPCHLVPLRPKCKSHTGVRKMIYYLKYKIGVTSFCFSDPDYAELQMDGHFIQTEHFICSEYTEGLGTFQ